VALAFIPARLGLSRALQQAEASQQLNARGWPPKLLTSTRPRSAGFLARTAPAITPKELSLMSKQEEAGLILKLYDLRREEKMRKARDWYFRDFNPQSFADFNAAMFGENSAYLRMVISYWEMAAALVKNGAISLELFSDSNGEHIGVFSKIEPLLGEIRAALGPQFAVHFEKLIDAMPDGRKRVAEARERMKAIHTQMAQAAQKRAKSA
jgi:hypothetical protein